MFGIVRSITPIKTSRPTGRLVAIYFAFLFFLRCSPFRSKRSAAVILISKVAANTSKNMFKLRVKRSAVDLEEVKSIGIFENDFETFETIMSLPKKHKIVLTLHYAEGYKCKEIAEIIGISEDAVKKRLQKGRELLKNELERTIEHD